MVAVGHRRGPLSVGHRVVLLGRRLLRRILGLLGRGSVARYPGAAAGRKGLLEVADLAWHRDLGLLPHVTCLRSKINFI